MIPLPVKLPSGSLLSSPHITDLIGVISFPQSFEKDISAHMISLFSYINKSAYCEMLTFCRGQLMRCIYFDSCLKRLPQAITPGRQNVHNISEFHLTNNSPAGSDHGGSISSSILSLKLVNQLPQWEAPKQGIVYWESNNWIFQFQIIRDRLVLEAPVWAVNRLIRHEFTLQEHLESPTASDQLKGQEEYGSGLDTG